MVAGAYMCMGRFEEARSTFEQALAQLRQFEARKKIVE
jgi:hypothetical protein